MEAGEQFDLKAVGRRSPFVHWRLFLQGIAAWYADEDEVMAQNFARIPQESALAGAVCEVRKLASGEAPTTASGREMQGKMQRYRAQAEQALSGNWRQRERAIRELYKDLDRAGRTRLAITLAVAFLRDYADEEGFIDLPPAWLGKRRALVEAHLFAEAGTLEASDLADCMPGVKDPDECAALWREYALMLRREGDWGEAEAAFRKSIRLAPWRSTFRSWYQQTDERDAVLKAWTTAFPDDTEPHVRIVQHARATGNVKLAREHLKILRALNYSPTELDAVEPYLQAEELAVKARSMKWPQLLEAVDKIGAEDSFARLAAEAVALRLGKPTAKQRKAWEAHLQARQRPALIATFADTAARLGLKRMRPFKLPAGILAQFDDASIIVPDLLRRIRFREQPWDSGRLFPDDSLRHVFETPFSWEQKLELLDALRERSMVDNEDQTRQAMYFLTVAMLSGPVTQQAVCLAYRVAILQAMRNPSYIALTNTLAAAARTLSKDGPYQELAARVVGAVQTQVQMSPEDCAELIEDLAVLPDYYGFLDFCNESMGFFADWASWDFGNEDFDDDDDEDFDEDDDDFLSAESAAIMETISRIGAGTVIEKLHKMIMERGASAVSPTLPTPPVTPPAPAPPPPSPPAPGKAQPRFDHPEFWDEL